MFNNPTGAGTMTSGGTESIVMAVKTYRDWARATKGITEPEMLVCDPRHETVDLRPIQGRPRLRPRRIRQGSGVLEDQTPQHPSRPCHPSGRSRQGEESHVGPRLWSAVLAFLTPLFLEETQIRSW